VEHGRFICSDIFVSWFSKSVAAVETIPHDSHLRWDEQRLLDVEKEREQVEQAFNETFRVIAEHDEFRKRLVSEQARITARRAALFEERANLLRVLGRIK
jgi:hypothetical protein